MASGHGLEDGSTGVTKVRLVRLQWARLFTRRLVAVLRSAATRRDFPVCWTLPVLKKFVRRRFRLVLFVTIDLSRRCFALRTSAFGKRTSVWRVGCTRPIESQKLLVAKLLSLKRFRHLGACKQTFQYLHSGSHGILIAFRAPLFRQFSCVTPILNFSVVLIMI